MPPASDTLHITRLFPCSLQRLWNAWSDWPTALKWWGPADWPAAFMEADFRVGGEWRAELRSAKGESLWQSGRFLEIEPPKHLVFTFKWDSDNHEDGAGVETHVRITFAETPDGARMDFTQSQLKSAESVTGHTHGWQSTFDRLHTFIGEPNYE